MKRILNISYYDCNNFGDRLGYHMINSVVPPDASLNYLSISKVADVDIDDYVDYDLVILGNGGSLFDSIITYELMEILKRSKKVIGIFGLQHYENIDINKFFQMMSFVDDWFARSRKDLEYTKPTKGCLLGDWLIDMFPMSDWTIDNDRPHEILNCPGNMGLDQCIRNIKQYRNVHSHRLHPLLCALTSAEVVKYTEQCNMRAPSRKFKAVLSDILGEPYEEGKVIYVNKKAVVRYKKEIKYNINYLKATIQKLIM